jgi:hypothetical protein
MKIHHLPDEKSRALKQQNLLYPKASAVSDVSGDNYSL